MIVRLAEYKDIIQIVRLSQMFVEELKTVTPISLNSDDVENSVKAFLQSENAHISVADEQLGLVGVIGGIKSPYFYNHSGYHTQEVLFYVIPSHRSTGIGKALLADLEAWSLQSGCLTIGMVAVAENPGMLQFYESTGYKLREYCVVKEL